MRKVIVLLSLAGFSCVYCLREEMDGNSSGRVEDGLATSRERENEEKRINEEQLRKKQDEKIDNSIEHSQGSFVEHNDTDVLHNDITHSEPVESSEAALKALGIRRFSLEEADEFELPSTHTVKEAMKEKGYAETFFGGIAKTPEAQLDLLELVAFDSRFRQKTGMTSATIQRLRRELQGRGNFADYGVDVAPRWLIKNAKKEIATLYKVYLEMDKRLDQRINRIARLLSVKLENFSDSVEDGTPTYNKILITREEDGTISVADANERGRTALNGFSVTGEEADIATQIFFKNMTENKMLLNPKELKAYVMKINNK